MAVPESSVVKENSAKIMKKKPEKPAKNAEKGALLTAQELKFAKCLAANDAKERRRALRALPKWLAERSKAKAFTYDDFMLIWKGLFYNMWMSDKPLVQEQCAEDIAKIVHLPSVDQSMLFFKAGLTTLINEWFGIDHLRLDKFMMFVRRLLRQAIVVINNNSFKKKQIEKLNSVLEETILSTSNHSIPLGLAMHFIEIYFEEVAKISEGGYHADMTTELVRPFIKKLSVEKDARILNCIRRFVFFYLIRQHDLGLEYEVKYEAWRAEGFPGSIDSMQKIKVSDEVLENENSDDDETQKEDLTEKPLDPRAGRVDVELPQLKFNPKSIAEALISVKFNPETNVKSREEISKLAKKFQKLSQGLYPLGIKRVHPKKRKRDDTDTNVTKAAKRLIKFDNKLLGKDKNKKRKRKATEPVDNGVPAKKVKKIKTDNIREKTNKTEHKKSTVVNGEVESVPIKKKKKEKLNGTEIPHKLKKIGKNKIKKPPIGEKKKDVIKNLVNDTDNLEYVFERNSGVWYVYVNEEENGKKKGANSSPKKIAISPSSSVEIPKNEGKTQPSASQVLNGSPKSGLQPVQLFDSPKTPENSGIFGKPADWDDELKEGEYELFLPSKKYLEKAKRKKSKSTEDLVSAATDDSRKRLRSATLKKISPKLSAKKVRINMKLNREQEVHEHIKQLRMSPHIPYDSEKKPGKPLLKTPSKLTPINPFYKLRLSF